MIYLLAPLSGQRLYFVLMLKNMIFSFFLRSQQREDSNLCGNGAMDKISISPGLYVITYNLK